MRSHSSLAARRKVRSPKVLKLAGGAPFTDERSNTNQSGQMPASAKPMIRIATAATCGLGVDQLDQQLGLEPVGQHDRLGAAVDRCLKQFERSTALLLRRQHRCAASLTHQTL